ncbi:MAG: helix-turn-helix domain-containing protein [Pelagimonas sp.]|uniref:helix-turn-helix domain-containing protein n=1 Tax=Pelagimonas sp. TaxID=2073170 RepID=UPI003D6C2308
MKPPGFLTKPMPPAPVQAPKQSLSAPPRPEIAKDPVKAGSLSLVTQTAPWKYDLLHDRADNVLIYLTRGQGVVIVNGVRRGLSTNQAMYLPAGTLFAFDMPKTVQGLMMQSPAGLTNRMPRECVHLRVRDSLAQAEIISEIDTMGRELMHNRPLKDEALEAHVRLIAVWLHRQIQSGASELFQDNAACRLAQKFAQSLVRDYHLSLGVSDYAERLDVTPTHLTRVCRKSCGKTAADFLAERRLFAARIALSTTKQPIKDIAAGLGFTSAAYFTRFIQTQSGMSPSELRRVSVQSHRR